ncbi:uncharacterized protein LOC106129035 [Amyelois transitella]|uniref:uncharacterized protein LOC106129035 n=1 Tax=Amyelois transitella TaxID=680683 RepID=UPI00299064F7|nr:uncharacterized protein LOC106129035 [Amyelois transitella]
MAHKSAISNDPAFQRTKLIAQIGQFKGQLTRAQKFAMEQQEQVLVDCESIELRIKGLQDSLVSYRNHKLSLQLLDDKIDDSNFEEDDLEELCLFTISSMKKILNSAKGPENHNSTIFKDTTPEYSAMTRKLPQLEIPYYDGKDVVQYKTFMDMFMAVIGGDTNLAPIQKLFYLRKYLKGDALMLVEGLPLVNSSYDDALRLLNNRYDNKCILVTHHINKLLDIQAISKGTAQNLRQFVSSARQLLGALNGLGQKTEHWDMIVITILMRKLDSYSCRAYFTDRNQDALPTLDDFFKFVEKRALSFEESQHSEASNCYIWCQEFQFSRHAMPG